MLDPSPPPLPSLVALRAFEVAARSGSFRRAAEELHVSPAAIAQHVKTLEAWARQPLFDRSARGVTLTDAGQRVRPALTDAFRQLLTATHQMRDGNPRRRTIRLAASPAIAELVLTPRLDVIRAGLPDVDVAIHALERRPDLPRDGFDASFFFERVAHGSDELTLVAAPRVAASLADLSSLASVPRLIDRAWESDWHRWGGAEHPLSEAPLIEFTLFSMAVRAAVDGHGALVGRRSLLADFLAEGALVEPFDRRISTGDAIRLDRGSDPSLAPIDDLMPV